MKINCVVESVNNHGDKVVITKQLTTNSDSLVYLKLISSFLYYNQWSISVVLTYKKLKESQLLEGLTQGLRDSESEAG